MTTASTASTPAPPFRNKKRLPILQGLLPIDMPKVPADLIAGVTLAALAIPEVMGYTAIAGMPVIAGLYTILLPMLAFAIFGSSRHLVVGADSATAAVMATGLAGLAVAGSTQHVALAGLLALMAGVFLILARLIGLGFLADFLSRTVLIGFLTGVGIQVACGQVGGMLGISPGKGVTIAGIDFTNTIGKLISTLAHIGQISWTTVAVSAGALGAILGLKLITGKIPGALVVVIGAIFISWKWDLASHGVTILGLLPSGLPHIGLPDVELSRVPALMGTAMSIFVLVLAQSAATSRAYAAKYNDRFDENVDLVGFGVANAVAGVSGTFIVNGSPTKTQMVDGAGGRSQLAQVATGIIVLVVLLFLTAPIQYMPKAVLSSVVFLIGVELVDIAGMRKVLRLRANEFVIATLVAAVVVCVGVEQGIVVAIVASIIDHLRRSYRPGTAVLQCGTDNSWPGMVRAPMLAPCPASLFTGSLAASTTPTPTSSLNRPALLQPRTTHPAGSASTLLPSLTSTTAAAKPSDNFTACLRSTTSSLLSPNQSKPSVMSLTGTALGPVQKLSARFQRPSTSLAAFLLLGLAQLGLRRRALP